MNAQSQRCFSALLKNRWTEIREELDAIEAKRAKLAQKETKLHSELADIGTTIRVLKNLGIEHDDVDVREEPPAREEKPEQEPVLRIVTSAPPIAASAPAPSAPQKAAPAAGGANHLYAVLKDIGAERDWVHRSLDRLAKPFGAAAPTLMAAIKELEKEGRLSVQRVPKGEKRGNWYFLGEMADAPPFDDGIEPAAHADIPADEPDDEREQDDEPETVAADAPKLKPQPAQKPNGKTDDTTVSREACDKVLVALRRVGDKISADSFEIALKPLNTSSGVPISLLPGALSKLAADGKITATPPKPGAWQWNIGLKP